jgi:drug/metabolite transporter (DMT)-like permease
MMVGSLFMLAFQDSLVKLVSSDVSLWQYQFVRAAFNLVLLSIMTRLIWGHEHLRPRRLWAVALRSTFLAVAMTLFFGGIPFLSLSSLAAGLYVFPLFVALLSGVVLGERVGPRRVAAIICGFTGSLLMLKPGTDAFSLVGLMPIGAALCYAATILTTRRLCREESPVTLTYGVAFSLLIVGAAGITVFSFTSPTDLATSWPYVFTGWNAAGVGVFGIIAICSFLNMFANIGLAKAYQSAEPSWLAPFDYSYLVFATFWGFVMWDDLPDGFSFLGMFLIAGAGTFVAWRERKESRDQRLADNTGLQ